MQMKRYQRRLKNMIKDGIDEANTDATRAQLEIYTARYDELLDISSYDLRERRGGGGGGGGGMVTYGDDDGTA